MRYSLYFFSFFITVLFIMMCKPDLSKPKMFNDHEYTVITIDSCEYISAGVGTSELLSHKGNCKYCWARLGKLLKIDSFSLTLDSTWLIHYRANDSFNVDIESFNGDIISGKSTKNVYIK